MQEITIGKIYKHYKGNKYRIINFAKHSETLEEMIIYESVDSENVWARPKNMWNDIIDEKGTLRFTLC